MQRETVQFFSYEGADIRPYGLGVANLSVLTLQEAEESLQVINDARNRFGAQRTRVFAKHSQLERMLSSQQKQRGEMADREQDIRSVDVAEEITQYSLLQVRESAAMAILAQFNSISKNVLTLLGHA